MRRQIFTSLCASRSARKQNFSACRRKPFSRQSRRSLCYRRVLSKYKVIVRPSHVLQEKEKDKAIHMLCLMAVGGQPREHKLTDRCSNFLQPISMMRQIWMASFLAKCVSVICHVERVDGKAHCWGHNGSRSCRGLSWLHGDCPFQSVPWAHKWADAYSPPRQTRCHCQKCPHIASTGSGRAGRRPKLKEFFQGTLVRVDLGVCL